MTGSEKPKKQRDSTRGAIEHIAKLLSVEDKSESVVSLDKANEPYYQEISVLLLVILIKLESQNIERIDHAVNHLPPSVPNSVKDGFVNYLVRRALASQVSELKANIPVRLPSSPPTSSEEIEVDEEPQ